MQPSRRRTILVAAAVAIVLIAGLVISGPVGGVLLLIVAAMLLLITYGTWGRVTAAANRPLHLLVLVAVLALGVAKLAGVL